jgi:hypothetical protein
MYSVGALAFGEQFMAIALRALRGAQSPKIFCLNARALTKSFFVSHSMQILSIPRNGLAIYSSRQGDS